ncbi:MAG TPA: trypsin-like serine protease [Pseudobdellovibrionaceae bacterium]|nr:trypsin-like serine protease [Pseudobdellovibrionaceae bacterium]
MKTFTLIATALLLGLAACAPSSQTENLNQPVATTNGIIGGTEVHDRHDALRSVVALYDTGGGFLCTGTLIDKNLVVTAAHCIPQDISKMLVIFGNKVQKTAPMAKVNGAIAYPTWNPRSPRDQGDIAVVSFEGTTPDFFRPLPILPEQYARVLRKGTLVMMLGYGLTDAINKTGSGVLRYTSARIEDAQYGPTEILLDESLGKGTCSGDSGGPVIIMVGEQAHILAVTSRGDQFCNNKGVYTKTTAYKAWIDEAAGKLRKQAGGDHNNTFYGL